MFYSSQMINMTNSKHLVQPMLLDQRFQRCNQNNILFELVVALEIDGTGQMMPLIDCVSILLFTKSRYSKWIACQTGSFFFFLSKFPFLHTQLNFASSFGSTDCKPASVSNWSFDENCLFCCLRREKVKVVFFVHLHFSPLFLIYQDTLEEPF